MKDLTVLEAKRYGVYTCEGSDTLRSVVARMEEYDISALVVVDEDGYLRGIITRTDLIQACYERDDWAIQPVEPYMTQDVVTVDPDDRLAQVMKLLLDRRIHRVVAVRSEIDGRRPVAVLSAADVIYHMARWG